MNNFVKFENILKEQEKLDEKGKFSIISMETGNFIHLLIKRKNPKKVLEIGTSVGYSSIWIASALNKNAELITIERWPERAELAKKFFKRSKLPIRLVEGDALNLIPKLKMKLDAVFIDATKSEYLNYLNSLIKNKKLNKNALIIADNTISHAAKMRNFLNFSDKKNAVTAEIGKGISFFKV